MTPDPLEQALVYFLGLALGWALIPQPPPGRPMIPKTVAAVKSFLQALLPTRGEALVVKVVQSFDKMIADLERAQQQIHAKIDGKYAVLAQERRYIAEREQAVRKQWDAYSVRVADVSAGNQPLYESVERARRVVKNITALVAK